MWYEIGDTQLEGLQLFDSNDKKVYQSAYKAIFDNPEYDFCETVLKEGERIVGFESFLRD